MPEGPECASITDGLRLLLVGQSINLIGMVPWKSSKFFRGLELALSQITFPLFVERVDCKGKQIFFIFRDASDKHWYALSNLGMTGFWSSEEESHAHLDFQLENSTHVYYCDARRIGNFVLTNNKSHFQGVLDELAPSILGHDEICTEEIFATRLQACKQKYLVPCLMDQHLICSGIGNYLLSEVLYATRLHPETRCHQLTSLQVQQLYHNIVAIMQQSYTTGGMSMKDYRKPDGSKGTYMFSLAVYNKTTTPDGHQVVKTTGKHQRSIFWDPLIQVV